ncbi:MAG: transcriptional repressor LexA [Planctomycetota bacterium]|jgi:repressor LexA|nr:transcriptional repressor LexA [Planctomycetota bacterium]
MSLPPRQECILRYFADAEDQGRQASRAEAAKDLGYAFPSAVSKHIEALVRKGLVEADREKKRNVRLTELGWEGIGRCPAALGVPVIGAIAAGSPILATENHGDYLNDITPQPGRFALKVRGDSMIDAGILDGDLAVIDHGDEVPDGRIGAVIVDEEATLKRVRYRRSELILEPANQAYEPIVVDRKRAVGGVQVVGPLRFIYRAVH